MAWGIDMESMYFLIPASLLVLLGASALLIWAVNSGQYDDMEREGERILQDDDLTLNAELPKSSGADAQTDSQLAGDERDE